MTRPRATWARQLTVPKMPLARKAIATGGWSLENAPLDVIARTCTTKKRRVADDLLALEDQKLDRPGDPRREAEAPGPIRIRCAVARPPRGPRPARIKDQTTLNRNPSILVRVLIAQSQKKLLASIMRKVASASSETSVATPTKRTAGHSLHDLMKNRMKTALTKNPMQKVPVAWLCQSAATTR